MTTEEEANIDRRDGRLWCEEVLADLANRSEAYIVGFRRRMLKEFKVEELDPKSMTEQQSQTFGRRVINFGMYRDRRYDDVPLEYLEWFADEGVQLTRYIHSRRVQAEREQPE